MELARKKLYQGRRFSEAGEAELIEFHAPGLEEPRAGHRGLRRQRPEPRPGGARPAAGGPPARARAARLAPGPAAARAGRVARDLRDPPGRADQPQAHLARTSPRWCTRSSRRSALRPAPCAPRLRILLVASEVAPFAKTGGLADVAGALPRALARARPRRAHPDAAATAASEATPAELRVVGAAPPGAARRPRRSRARCSRAAPASGVPVYLLEHDALLRPRRRSTAPPTATTGTTASASSSSAAARSRAWRGSTRRGGRRWQPQVIHANDWQTGLLPVYLAHALPRPPARWAAWPRVFTIHNLAYQGVFWHYDMPMTGLGWDLFTPAGHRVLRQAQLPQGRPDLLRPADHGEPHLRARDPHAARSAAASRACCEERSAGPPRAWSTASTTSPGTRPKDPAIAAARTRPDDPERKAACREALRRELGLRRRRPGPAHRHGDAGSPSRRASTWCCEGAARHPGRRAASSCVLGSGDARLEEAFRARRGRAPGPGGGAHRLRRRARPPHLRGRRRFLMPSRYEPCGLGQLIALRYGDGARRAAHRRARRHRHRVRRRPGERHRLPLRRVHGRRPARGGPAGRRHVPAARALEGAGANAMAEDFSWDASAREYVTLYRKALKARSAR